MKGEWQVKKEELKVYRHEAYLLAKTLEKVSYEWVPREQNSMADKLANEGIKAK